MTPGVSGNSDQPLTLPSFQQAILQSRLLGSVNRRNKELVHGPCWDKDSEGSLLRIVELLSWYFDKLEELSPERWRMGKAGYLCSNFGVSGHVRLLGEVIRFTAKEQNYEPIQCEVEEIIDTISPYLIGVFDFVRDANHDTFSDRFKVPFGSGGPSRYFFRLVELVRDAHQNFEPDGFEDFIQTVSNEAIQQADDQVRWIQTIIPTYVLDVLKSEFGKDFFEKGVPDEIQKSCQNKRIDDKSDNRLPVETYLDWLDIRRIVEKKGLREKYRGVLSIQLPEESNGRHFYAGWFDKMNEIRRISAHPAGRLYKNEHTEFLSEIVSELVQRLPQKYTDNVDATFS